MRRLGEPHNKPLDPLYQHQFHINSITFNYNIKSTPTKHKGAIPVFVFHILLWKLESKMVQSLAECLNLHGKDITP
jgi:hypothetical protein